MLCASSLPDSRSRAPQGPASQNRAGLPWPVLGGSVTMVSGTATPVLTIAKGESLLTVTVATPFPTNHCFSQIVICGNCGGCSAESTGTTVERNPSSGVA